MKLHPVVLMLVFYAMILLVAAGMMAQQAPVANQPDGSPAQTTTSPAPPNNSPSASPSTLSTPRRPSNATPKAANANSITLQGCVNGGKQGYTLLQQNTGASFELESNSYQLRHTRGKLVQVTGREMPPDAKSHGMPRLDLQGLQVLSDHCALPGKASGASTNTPEPNSTGNAEQPSVATPKYQSPGAPDQTPPSQGNNPTNWGRTSGPPSPGTGNPPPPK